MNPLQKAEKYASSQYDVNQYTEPDSVKGTGWTDCRDAWLAGYEADRWIACRDKMPENEILEQGERVLKVIVYHKTMGIMYGIDYCFKKFTITSNYIDMWGMGSCTDITGDVTHWQPLPKTPTL